jgi:predicted lipid-binding transport protein (Tim44 family)
MTAPRAPQWPLAPALRLGALALLFASVGFLVEGWVSMLLWLGAIVFLVFAAINLAKGWRRRP